MEVCYNCFGTKSTSGPCPHCGYDPTGARELFPMSLHTDSILNGRYIVGRVLGQGGFGITYIALDDHTQRRVAIKEYLPTEFVGRVSGSALVQPYSGARRENFDYGKERFLEEARTLAEFIGDEHIVRIYSYFEENGTAYFVMEYVEGLPLDKYMATRGGRLTVEEADELLLPLMDALELVHSKGIVHRDIAPDNIIITPEHKAKLLDFGAARYSTGEKSKSLDVVIKHGFAPKEQYTRRGRQGPFTDVYAMAATYYYAITGRVPPESIDRMEEDDLISPNSLGARISSRAEAALYKGLEVSASSRYQSMAAFRDALRNADSEDRLERERQEREAAEKARLEQERREKEAAEKARLEEERREKEAAEKAHLEEERREKEAAEKARLEQERQEKEAAEKARLERERREKEAAEKARLERERREKEAAEKARLERERQEREAAEKARKEQERREKEAARQARAEQKRREKEAAEKAREERRAQKQQDRPEKTEPAAEQPGKKKSVIPLIAAAAALLIGVVVFFAGRGGQKPAAAPSVPVSEVQSGTVEAAATQTGEIGPETAEEVSNTEISTEEEAISTEEAAVVEASTEGVSEDGLVWTIEDGVLTIRGNGPMADYEDFKGTPWYAARDSFEAAVIENGVTSIGQYAFSYCSGLKSLTLPESIRTIGDSAFRGCSSLEELKLPDGTEIIGEYAFYNCTGIQKMSIPGTLVNIGAYAFYGCRSIHEWQIWYNSEWAVSIGDGNEEVADYIASVLSPNSETGESETLAESEPAEEAEAVPVAADMTWEVKRGVLTISGSGGMADYASNKDAPWYTSRAGVTSVVIQEGMTSIGANAFAGFNNLKSVKIPASVKSINTSALNTCEALATIQVDPASTSYRTDSYGVLYNGEGTRILLIPKSVTATLTIMDGVTRIEAGTFADCSRLKSLKLPESVTSIGERAFSGCINLTSIKFPSRLDSIGERAFYNCDKLAALTIPDGVTVIGNSTFAGCDKLTTLKLPEGITSFGNSAFADCPLLKNVNFPTTLTSIGANAFHNCRVLTGARIPDGVTEIPMGAFDGCENMGSVSIPWNVTSIGEDAFNGCKLKSVEIPDSVKTIGANAFYNCAYMESVTFYEGLTDIGDMAFYNCQKLTKILIPSTVTKIGSRAFANCSDIREFNVAEGNTAYRSDEYGGLLTGDGARLIQVPVKRLGEYILSDGLKEIGASAFYGCRWITKIVIPEGTETIGGSAFRGCDGLKEISIPASLTKIDMSAFADCIEMRTFRVAEGNPAYHSGTKGELLNADGTTLLRAPQSISGDYTVQKGVTRIGSGAFADCDTMEVLILPEGVTAIESNAFYDCDRFRRIHIPASMETIGDNAFSGCWKFRVVYYFGTKDQWKTVQKGSNYYLTNASVQYK